MIQPEACAPRTNVETWVARLCAVSCDKRKLGPFLEQFPLLQVLRQIIWNDKFALDDALGTSVGAYQSVSDIYGESVS